MTRRTPTRTLVTRGLLSLTAVTGLGAAFLAGSSVGGGAGQVGGRTGSDASPAAYVGSHLRLPGSCDALLASYVERGVDLVGPWGWSSPVYATGVDDSAVAGPTAELQASGARNLSTGAASAVAPAPSTVRATNGDTGTNVQEAGVDEPDLVKTDGRTLYRVQHGDVVAYDVSGATVERLGSLDLPGDADGAELLLSGQVLIAIARGDASNGERTEVTTIDVADPASPAVTQVAEYDAGLVTARLHDGVVRLVLQAGLPELDFDQPGDHTTEFEATHANQDRVRDSVIEDWLPTVSYDDGPAGPLVDCADVAVPDDEASLGTLVVVGFDAPAPEAPSTTGLGIDTDLVYASTDQLYVASAPYDPWLGGCLDRCVAPGLASSGGGVTGVAPDQPVDEPVDPPVDPGVIRGPATGVGTTDVYAFDLDGLETTFAADGTVDGTVRDRWSMDEYDGVLRLAVGDGGENAVVTLRQDGDDLVELGRLDGLGVGETIQSVRWFDTLAVVVTFRQMDPLHAVDLTDPADPELIGSLEVPGFSGYLHPLGQHRLLGLGEGPDGADGMAGWGAQAGLFDVTDLTDPRRLDVVSYGSGSQALATMDPRQLTWLPDRRTVLTVVLSWTGQGETGSVSVLRLGDGTLDNRMVDVERGGDVYAVRLVPLADGRVVLVTGDDVEFFDV